MCGEWNMEDSAQWPQLLDGAMSGIMLVDSQERYVFSNLAACRFLGVERDHLVGRQVSETMHELRMPLLLALDVLRHGSRPVVTGRFPLGGLAVRAEFSRVMNEGGEFGGLSVLINDVTEGDEFYSRMLRVERMAVLGELAAAMAHEINSPLGGVMESVRIIKNNLANMSKVERFLPLVQRGLEQIELSVKQMLRLTAPHEEPLSRMVLEEVVEQCVDFLRFRQGETQAALEFDQRTERTVVMAEIHSLSQALINLINNAFDAVAGQRDGRVVVRTVLVPSMAEVMIQVCDNGPGIPAGSRARIFEPFYTTKASGKGTGLGLSICARTAARHGGRVVVSESDGGGAMFALILPRIGQRNEVGHVTDIHGGKRPGAAG